MGYRLSKIYTRTGDAGSTSLDGQQRVAKDDLRVEAVGTVDELNSALGMLLACPGITAEFQAVFTQIQHELFDFGGELSLPSYVKMAGIQVTRLEKTLDQWNATLPPLQEFILPRGNLATTTCHLARTICRRAERRLVSLHHREPVRAELLAYLNRLSDLLFVAARILAVGAGQEVLWDHPR